MAEIKRMRYFQHEFLDAEDFNDEQEYHRQMRYRHNRDFHTWGIGHGLEVGLAEDQETGSETKVTVNPGTAVDGEGKEIILPLSRTIDFDQPAYQGDTSYYITIKWHEQPGLPRQEDSSKRWEEVPDIDVTADSPQDSDMNLVLACVKLRGNKTVESIDPSGRKYAALEIGDATVTTFKIADGAVTTAKIADKAVTNAKLRDGSVDEDKLSSIARGKLVTNGNDHNHSGGDGARIKHSSLTLDGGNNPHHVGMSQLSDLNANNRRITNLSDPAQNNEAANQGYVDAKDAEVKGYVNSVTKGKLVTNGNSHDHSGGDGARIKHSSLNKDDGRNPHNTAAADVGALATTGGTVNGSISVNGNVGIGTTTPGAKLHVNGLIKGGSLDIGDSFTATVRCADFLIGYSGRRERPGRALVDKKTTLVVNYEGDWNECLISGKVGIEGGDYAEYFESKDGKEIKAGISVVMDSGKIRAAKKSEIPIGVISANPGIVGGVHIEWPKKYLRDEFGNQIMEEYKEEIMKPKKKKVKDDDGQPVMVGSGKFETKTRPKLNPEYDETKEYIPREKRPEWNCVGLLGQLPLRKGQPTAPTWIKIKDISKDVELWLVK